MSATLQPLPGRTEMRELTELHRRGAPDAVSTVRSYGTGSLYGHRLVRKSDHSKPRNRRLPSRQLAKSLIVSQVRFQRKVPDLSRAMAGRLRTRTQAGRQPLRDDRGDAPLPARPGHGGSDHFWHGPPRRRCERSARLLPAPGIHRSRDRPARPRWGLPSLSNSLETQE